MNNTDLQFHLTLSITAHICHFCRQFSGANAKSESVYTIASVSRCNCFNSMSWFAKTLCGTIERRWVPSIIKTFLRNYFVPSHIYCRQRWTALWYFRWCQIIWNICWVPPTPQFFMYNECYDDLHHYFCLIHFWFPLLLRISALYLTAPM